MHITSANSLVYLLLASEFGLYAITSTAFSYNILHALLAEIQINWQIKCCCY